MLRRNMRRELISEDELRNHLRVQGMEDLDQVKLVCMEPEGELTVIKREEQEQGGSESQSSRRKAPVG